MNFVKGLFSDGEAPSSSRVLSFMFGLFVCGWVTYIVRKTGQLPDFSGVALFVGTPYFINRGTTVLSDYVNKK